MTVSQLFEACKTGDLAKVRRAVAEGLEVKNAVDQSDFSECSDTLLHYASGYENLCVELIEPLL